MMDPQAALDRPARLAQDLPAQREPTVPRDQLALLALRLLRQDPPDRRDRPGPLVQRALHLLWSDPPDRQVLKGWPAPLV
jgi:hypothetical protein